MIVCTLSSSQCVHLKNDRELPVSCPRLKTLRSGLPALLTSCCSASCCFCLAPCPQVSASVPSLSEEQPCQTRCTLQCYSQDACVLKSVYSITMKRPYGDQSSKANSVTYKRTIGPYLTDCRRSLLSDAKRAAASSGVSFLSSLRPADSSNASCVPCRISSPGVRDAMRPICISCLPKCRGQWLTSWPSHSHVCVSAAAVRLACT